MITYIRYIHYNIYIYNIAVDQSNVTFHIEHMLDPESKSLMFNPHIW